MRHFLLLGCALASGFALALLAAAPLAAAAELVPGGYYWYVPEHEKYARTEFFTQPSFQAPQVKIAKTHRFRYGPGRRGWVLLEFDGGIQAFIHLRILRTLLYDASAVDPWYEFKRASVFPEEPAKIEARLKPPPPATPTVDSKVPIWKRYKEGWSIYKGRESDPDRAAMPLPEKKPRIRPLPPSANPTEDAAAGSRNEAETLPETR